MQHFLTLTLFLLSQLNSLAVFANTSSILNEESKLHHQAYQATINDDTALMVLDKEEAKAYVLSPRVDVSNFKNDLVTAAKNSINRRLNLEDDRVCAPWERLSANVFGKLRDNAWILPLEDAFALGYMRHIEGWAEVFDLLQIEMLRREMASVDIKSFI